MTQTPQPNILITVAPALIAAAVALIVLILTDILTRSRESRGRRQTAAMQYRERQLGEFYGPLLSLIEQIQSVYAVKTKLLRAAKDKLSPEQRTALKKLQEYERRVAKVNLKLQKEVFEPVEERIEKEMYARKVE